MEHGTTTITGRGRRSGGIVEVQGDMPRFEDA